MPDLSWLVPLGMLAAVLAIYWDFRRIRRTPAAPPPKPAPLAPPTPAKHAWAPPPRPNVPRPRPPVITDYEWAMINNKVAQMKLYAATIASVALGVALAVLMMAVKPAWGWLFWIPGAYCWWELVRPVAREAKQAATRLKLLEDAQAYYEWNDG